ncbi:hypothetical protein OIDMADRAFT_36145 [Oidiodendron maius Zn]|uniref:Uncharacterized protein n=1 Tax=Oidiodendron maius (strain Zn) TaxID=913774 RepID=A0A0C3GA12_OIDMZ|nr:hypothetical protein OIDMADRAFT_36145 [Oidiodendron maius Zn]
MASFILPWPISSLANLERKAERAVTWKVLRQRRATRSVVARVPYQGVAAGGSHRDYAIHKADQWKPESCTYGKRPVPHETGMVHDAVHIERLLVEIPLLRRVNTRDLQGTASDASPGEKRGMMADMGFHSE